MRAKAGSLGGSPGDLYLLVRVREDEKFQRQENDLIYRMTLTFSQAALGDEDQHQDVRGVGENQNSLRNPERPGVETQGKGIQACQPLGKGRLADPIAVKTPSHLSTREKELFRELREIETRKERSKFESKKDALN